MTRLRVTAPVGDTDRFGLALLFATLIHALILLGVGFEGYQANRTPLAPTLDITLVPTKSEQRPDQADYLAQASQDGGGNTEERVRPQSPDSGAQQQAETGAMPSVASPEASQAARHHVTVLDESAPTQAADTTPDVRSALPSADQLVSRSMQIATLNAELSESVRAYAQRPRSKRISARTQEYQYAAYMQAWISKVERIGNLNYPDEARRLKLSGALLLDVALNPDGTISGITLLRSSGHKVLDDAAMRIVRLSAPFSPFPEDIRTETDVLHIIRTWEFLSSNRLHSK